MLPFRRSCIQEPVFLFLLLSQAIAEKAFHIVYPQSDNRLVSGTPQDHSILVKDARVQAMMQ